MEFCPFLCSDVGRKPAGLNACISSGSTRFPGRGCPPFFQGFVGAFAISGLVDDDAIFRDGNASFSGPWSRGLENGSERR